MKVNANIYCVHSASFQSLVKDALSLLKAGGACFITSKPADGPIEKLFFDVKTGLLVRRYTESSTPLGKLPLQTDYEDYRDVDGIKQPFLIHWAFPGRVWGRKIDEIKQNVSLDDAKFNPLVSRP